MTVPHFPLTYRGAGTKASGDSRNLPVHLKADVGIVGSLEVEWNRKNHCNAAHATAYQRYTCLGTGKISIHDRLQKMSMY